jgi:hypothetical protein
MLDSPAGFQMTLEAGQQLNVEWSSSTMGNPSIDAEIMEVHEDGTVSLKYEKERQSDEESDIDAKVDLFNLKKRYKSQFNYAHGIRKWSFL